MNRDDAFRRLALAKLAEDQAKTNRLHAEEEVLKFVDSKDEGSVTTIGTDYKAVTSYSMTRTVDEVAIARLKKDKRVPLTVLKKVFPVSHKLSLTELRKVMADQPDTYRELAAAVTTKPAKPTIKIEPVLQQSQEAAA